MSSPLPPRTYDAAKRAALDSRDFFTGISKVDRTDHFQRSIILNRLFANEPENWVLKGASALLWRDADSRTTRDIDLLRLGTEDISKAHHQLQDALNRPTTAPFDVTYHVSEPTKAWSPDDGLTQVSTVSVTLRGKGNKPLSQPLKIDLVTGDHMTRSPEIIPTHGLASLLRDEPQNFRLYPIHDHLADKIGATFKVFGDKPSTRIRDLADIVHIASTETISLSQAHHALEAVRLSHQAAPYPQKFTVPPRWEQMYQQHHKDFAATAPASFREALTRARALVNPILAYDGTKDAIWEKGQWTVNRPGLGREKAPEFDVESRGLSSSASWPS